MSTATSQSTSKLRKFVKRAGLILLTVFAMFIVFLLALVLDF